MNNGDYTNKECIKSSKLKKNTEYETKIDEIKEKKAKKVDKVVKRENKNILLICGEGFGNIVWVTPCVITLNKYGYKVDILCESYWPDAQLVFKNCEIVNKVFTDSSEIYFSKYEHVIQTRWGKKHPKQTIRYDKLDLSKFHEIDENFTIIKKLGINENPPMPFFSNLKWDGFSKEKNRVVIADPKVRQQIWDRRKYPHVFNLAISLSQMKYKVSIIGSKEDCKSWTKYPKGIKIIEESDIYKAADAMRKNDLYIGQDCGLTQIAAAMDMPTIALFGATRVSKNAPKGKRVKIYKSDLPCSPCQLKREFGDCNNFRCMDFSIRLLVREVRNILC